MAPDSAVTEIEGRKSVGIGKCDDNKTSSRIDRALQVGVWTLCHQTAALAVIVPDDRPGMFRIWADGVLSDIVNLARAKDAALAICERGPPRRDARLLRWIGPPREAQRRSLVRASQREASQ